MNKFLSIAAAAFGLSAVILGAFGAHALQPYLNDYAQSIWDKGVQYQFYHALAILTCTLYVRHENSTTIRNAAICFVIGIICFSGSLFLLATRDLTNIPAFALGPVTPIGGFFFIAGWGLILINALKSDERRK